MTARLARAAPLYAAARGNPLVLLVATGGLLGVFAALAKGGAAAGWHPLAFLLWSLAASGAILTVVAVNRGQAPKRDRRTLAYNLGSGALSAMLPNALSFAAIAHVGAGFVALGFAFPPLLSYLMALALRMERFRPLRAAGLALAFLGVVVLVAAKVSLGDAGLAWIATALAAPVFVASGNIFRSLYWPRGATPLALAPGMLIAAAATLLPVLVVLRVPLAPPADAMALALLAAEIAVFTALYSLIFRLQALAGAVYLSQIGSVGAAAGGGIAVLVLGETADPSLAAAAVAILAGALLVNRTRQRRGHAPPCPPRTAAARVAPIATTEPPSMISEPAWFSRLAIALAGVLGAVGVTAAAGATHLGDTRILGSLALIALTQAPAVLALALFAGRHWLMRLAAMLIGLGALVFSADLAALHLLGASPLPLAAPVGGSAMILGWIVLIPAAFVGRR